MSLHHHFSLWGDVCQKSRAQLLNAVTNFHHPEEKMLLFLENRLIETKVKMVVEDMEIDDYGRVC